MHVLLDTFYLYRFMEAGGSFSEAERHFFEAHAAHLYLSAVSIWEMRLKFHARHPSGARKSRFAPEDVITAFARHDVTFLPMAVTHAATRLAVPVPHRDPFDELLLVQAQEEGLKLLTSDRRLVDHPLTVTP